MRLGEHFPFPVENRTAFPDTVEGWSLRSVEALPTDHPLDHRVEYSGYVDGRPAAFTFDVAAVIAEDASLIEQIVEMEVREAVSALERSAN